jgi:hypothetical protein
MPPHTHSRYLETSYSLGGGKISLYNTFFSAIYYSYLIRSYSISQFSSDFTWKNIQCVRVQNLLRSSSE